MYVRYVCCINYSRFLSDSIVNELHENEKVGKNVLIFFRALFKYKLFSVENKEDLHGNGIHMRII